MTTYDEYQFMRTHSESSSRVFGGNGYKRDGWNVSLVGVRPDVQGLGIGRALVDLVIEKVIVTLPLSSVLVDDGNMR